MWRRLVELLTNRTTDPSTDERSIQTKRLNAFAREVPKVNAEIHALAVGANDRLASYRRVRIGR